MINLYTLFLSVMVSPLKIRGYLLYTLPVWIPDVSSIRNLSHSTPEPSAPNKAENTATVTQNFEIW